MLKLKLFLLLLGLLMMGCASTPESSSDPREKIDILLAADEYYRKGLLVQAEAKYRQILETNPRMYEANLKLGNIYVRKGQLEAAILAFERCIDIAPEQVRAWNNLGLTRVMQAIEVAREGIEVTDPKLRERKKLERLFEQLIQVQLGHK